MSLYIDSVQELYCNSGSIINSRFINYCPQTKLWEGNDFSPVCLSVHWGAGWLPNMHHRSHDQHPGAAYEGSASRGRLHPEGLHPGGGGGVRQTLC